MLSCSNLHAVSYNKLIQFWFSKKFWYWSSFYSLQFYRVQLVKVRVRIWDRVDNGQDLWVWVAERFICDKTQILFRVNLVSYLVSLATHQYNTSIFLDFCMVSLTLTSQWQGVIFSALLCTWHLKWSKLLSLFVRIKKQYIGWIWWKYDFLKMSFSSSFSLEGYLL